MFRINYHSSRACILCLVFIVCRGTGSAQLNGLRQEASVFSKYNYYTTEKDISIIAEFPYRVTAGKYILSIFNNNKLIAGPVIVKNNLLTVNSPLPAFESGKTELQYTISIKDKIVQKGTIDITRLPPKSNEVKIDLQTGGLVVDGLPFFPFGFYCRPAGILPEQEISHGFNLIAPYQSNLPATYEERKAFMDRCARIGMKVQYSVNSLIGSGHNGSRGLDMTEDEKEAVLKKEILAFRDHPALLSWYINDEPDGQGRLPALLEKAYRLVHELDPYHPISIVFMLPGKFVLYRNTMDIAMTDPYPVPGPLDIVEHFVNQLNRDFHHEKSVWLVPQAFGGQEMWVREPTAKEIRLMTYLGLINGVKGIQYYTHGPGNLNPQSVSAWSVCSDMAVEVNQMSSFLLSAEAALPLITSDSGILARSFVQDGNLLIIAVNKENKPRPMTVRLSGTNKWTTSSTALLWFENRQIAFHNGRIDDIIDALGTRVYLTRLNGTTGSGSYYPGNLTANPGFEKIVSPGLPIGSNTKRSFPGKEEPGASFFADPAQSVEGMFSLRLITPVDSNGNKIRLLPIVLKAKNSYRVSIWAKAKRQETMPSFRISVDGPAQEKVFNLAKDWQQYSFIFRPDSSYSSAIVSFDLLTAGTAWFDLIQVTPDPLIGYTIGKGGVAKVSIASTIKDAQIEYSLNSGMADAGKTVYKEPILLNKASTIYARLVVGGMQVGDASTFIPVNKALGKTVTIRSSYAPQYAASGNSTITDGVMGSTAFKDGKWLGFLGKDVTATIDMKEITAIRSVSVNFLCDPNSGIFLPPKVLLYTSLNGKDFQLAGSYINSEVSRRGEPYLQSFKLDATRVRAKYIRLVAAAFGEIPEGYLFKGTLSWIFIDEVMVD